MSQKIKITHTIRAPVDDVWRAISGIGGLDKWFPIIATCEVTGNGIGATRVCGLADGAKLYETVKEIDDEARRFRYSIDDSPLPISGYLGTVEMHAVGDDTELSWSAEFDVDPAARDAIVTMLEGALGDGIKGLAADLES